MGYDQDDDYTTEEEEDEQSSESSGSEEAQEENVERRTSTRASRNSLVEEKKASASKEGSRRSSNKKNAIVSTATTPTSTKTPLRRGRKLNSSRLSEKNVKESGESSKEDDKTDKLFCPKCKKELEGKDALIKHAYWCESSRITRSKTGDVKTTSKKSTKKRRTAVKAQLSESVLTTPETVKEKRGRGRPKKVTEILPQQPPAPVDLNHNVEQRENIQQASQDLETKSDDGPVSCPKCNMRYRNSTSLQKHLLACSYSPSDSEDDGGEQQVLNMGIQQLSRQTDTLSMERTLIQQQCMPAIASVTEQPVAEFFESGQVEEIEENNTECEQIQEQESQEHFIVDPMPPLTASAEPNLQMLSVPSHPTPSVQNIPEQTRPIVSHHQQQVTMVTMQDTTTGQVYRFSIPTPAPALSSNPMQNSNIDRAQMQIRESQQHLSQKSPSGLGNPYVTMQPQPPSHQIPVEQHLHHHQPYHLPSYNNNDLPSVPYAQGQQQIQMIQQEIQRQQPQFQLNNAFQLQVLQQQLQMQHNNQQLQQQFQLQSAIRQYQVPQQQALQFSLLDQLRSQMIRPQIRQVFPQNIRQNYPLYEQHTQIPFSSHISQNENPTTDFFHLQQQQAKSLQSQMGLTVEQQLQLAQQQTFHNQMMQQLQQNQARHMALQNTAAPVSLMKGFVSTNAPHQVHPSTILGGPHSQIQIEQKLYSTSPPIMNGYTKTPVAVHQNQNNCHINAPITMQSCPTVGLMQQHPQSSGLQQTQNQPPQQQVPTLYQGQHQISNISSCQQPSQPQQYYTPPQEAQGHITSFQLLPSGILMQQHNSPPKINSTGLDKYRKVYPATAPRPIEPKPVEYIGQANSIEPSQLSPNQGIKVKAQLANMILEKQQGGIQFTAQDIASITSQPPLLESQRKSSVLTAVVRPMEHAEHPLQKISYQISQIGSPTTNPDARSGILQASRQEPTPAHNNVVLPISPVTAPPVVFQAPVHNITLAQKNVPTTPKRAVKRKAPGDSPKIKLRLKQQGDLYSINDIVETASSNADESEQNSPGKFKSLRISARLSTGEMSDVVIVPKCHIIPIPDSDDFDSNITIPEDDETFVANSQQKNEPLQGNNTKFTHRVVVVFDVTVASSKTVIFNSSNVREVWRYIYEKIMGTGIQLDLPPLYYPATKISIGNNQQGLQTNFNLKNVLHRAVQFLMKYMPKKNLVAPKQSSSASQSKEEEKPNLSGCARTEGYSGRKPFDMFGWLASKHRKPLEKISTSGEEIWKPTGVPTLQRYRSKEKTDNTLMVMWSTIHGRGLYTRRDIDKGEIVIEYAGEVIRSPVCEAREKYYETKGIGCYMFRINDEYIIDATMKGNAARFINHSCEPNCESRAVRKVRVGGTEDHILIAALRKISCGEELTYDYKFEKEENKIPCACASRKCRKYLN